MEEFGKVSFVIMCLLVPMSSTVNVSSSSVKTAYITPSSSISPTWTVSMPSTAKESGVVLSPSPSGSDGITSTSDTMSTHIFSILSSPKSQSVSSTEMLTSFSSVTQITPSTSASSTLTNNISNYMMSFTTGIAISSSSVSNPIDTFPNNTGVLTSASSAVIATENYSSTESVYSSSYPTEMNTFPTTTESFINGKDISFSFVLVINADFNESLSDRTTELFRNYSFALADILFENYANVPGILRIEIKRFTKGSVRVDYEIVIAGEALHVKKNHVDEYLTNATNSIVNVSIPDYIGSINRTETQRLNEERLENMNKTLLKPCFGHCADGHICWNQKCTLHCDHFNCQNDGICVLNREFKPRCLCKPLFTGGRCEKHKSDVVAYSEKLLLIIEIAGGAGGGVILFLFISLIIVCIKRGTQLKRDDDSTENGFRSGREITLMNGKSNPVYDKDNHSDVRNSGACYEVDPHVSGSRENGSINTYDDRRGIGREMEPEKKIVQREDGRLYQVIEDEDIGNNTFLYQPSYRHPMRDNGSRNTDLDAYEYQSTDSNSFYDHIDTSKEYRIWRPNLASKRSYYN